MNRRIFVTRLLPAEGMLKLKDFADRNSITLDVWDGELPPPKNELLRRARGCVGLVTLLTDRIDSSVMDAAGGGLKVVSNFAVGYNNIDCNAAVQRGLRIGHTPGVLTEATADMAFALMMAAARRLPESIDYARAGKWKTWMPLGFIGQDLHKKKVGIVGLGRIGYSFARKCHGGFDMEVLYTNRRPNEEAERQLGAKRVELGTLLRECDIISVHCALTPETTRLFGAREFDAMKKSAIFINTARGAIHDQSALIDACKTGKIFAAGLDVTDPEPPAADDEVFRVPNLIVAPHIASATFETRNNMSSICADNLIAGVVGNKLRAEVPETLRASGSKL